MKYSRYFRKFTCVRSSAKGEIPSSSIIQFGLLLKHRR